MEGEAKEEVKEGGKEGSKEAGKEAGRAGVEVMAEDRVGAEEVVVARARVGGMVEETAEVGRAGEAITGAEIMEEKTRVVKVVT